MSTIKLQNIRQCEGLIEDLIPLKRKIEERLNLRKYSDAIKPISLSNNFLQRISLTAGLSITEERSINDIENVIISKTGLRIHETTFARFNLHDLWSALLKLRYHHIDIDWTDHTVRSKVVNYEMLRGKEMLLQEGVLDEWLTIADSRSSTGSYGDIPLLNLTIGSYEDDIPAYLNLNGRDIPNTQIIVAGATGSGKSNLLAVLINEIRSLTIDSSYPVNFLLFDYKGEFSDPANSDWLTLFEVNETAILDPIKEPLPFTPFRDFTGRTQNEINLYASEMATALIAIDRARISANMNNRLAEAVINAYKKTRNQPITFQYIFDSYTDLQPPKDKVKDDSVKSVLKQLIRNNLFAEEGLNQCEVFISFLEFFSRITENIFHFRNSVSHVQSKRSAILSPRQPAYMTCLLFHNVLTL